MREEPLGQCLHEVKVDPTEIMMDVQEPTWKEVKEVVKKARSGSAPKSESNAVPYMVYPILLRKL